MRKKILLLLLFFLFAVVGSTCKKRISKYPVNMEGIWYGTSTGCEYALEINKNSTGKFMCLGGHFCNSDQIAKGVVKYNKKTIFFSKTKFTMVEKPSVVTTNDSIYAPDADAYFGQRKKYLILAKMKLEYKGADQITLYKYVEY